MEVNGYTIEPGADLRGVDLGGPYFIGTELKEAKLTGAQADEGTTWPAGFDPVAAGVIFE